jgi:hypothetical protein
MAIVSSKFIKATSLACLGLGIVLDASPALATVLTKQTFNGNFSLLSAPFESPFPESTDYSGFVVYDENNSLLDWAINLDELDFQLNPDSAQGADVNFFFFGENDWALEIDFGIAFDDEPIYDLERLGDSGIRFSYTSGVVDNFYVYEDPQPNIAITNSPATSVPEPSTVLALFALATIPLLKKTA